MKNVILKSLAFTCVIIMCTSMSSCSDDEKFINPTKTNGLPSAFIPSEGEAVSLSYGNGQLFQTRKKDGSSTDFIYDKGALKISTNPPSNVADGHGWRTFEQKNDSIILASSTGEPLFLTLLEEIKLNKWKQPARITKLGLFKQTDKGLVKERDINDYTLFTYDTAGKNLIKMEQFDGSNKLYCTTILEYDNANGTTSAIHLSSWLPAYWGYINNSVFNSINIQFLNHYNNITAITVNNVQEHTSSTYQYQYTYNKENYPIKITSNAGTPQKIDIQY